MPYYPIDPKTEGGKRRVVEADNPAAALKHAAQAVLTVGKPMSAADIVAHMQGGGTVEKAGAEAAPASETKGDAAE